MAIIYHKCQKADLDLLVQISRITFMEAFEDQNDPADFKAYIDNAFQKQKIYSELNNPNSTFYLVYLDNQLAGYFKMNTADAQTDLKEGNSTELERIYVLGPYQGKGIGKKVLEEVLGMASRSGKSFLWLGVWEHNGKAIDFYERNGFIKFDKHPYYIGKDKQIDWLMKHELYNFNQDKIESI